MIAYLLIALFALVAAAAFASLADSVVRARTAWRSIKADMAQQAAEIPASAVNVVRLHPDPSPARVIARPAPRLPHAVAA